MTKVDVDKVYLYRTNINAIDVPFERYRDLAYQALTMVELNLPAEGTILLKPNITITAEPETRIITHPGFIVGMLEALLDKGVAKERLVVAEVASSRGEEEWARVSGYDEALARLDMKLTGMTGLEGVQVGVPGGVVFDKLCLFPEVARCAFFFNVPVAKCHNLSCTTLNTKNLQGTVVSPQRHMCSVQQEDKQVPEEELARLTDSGLSLHEERFCNKHADMVSALRSLGMPRLCMIDGMVGRDGTAFREGRNHPLGWTLIGENEVHVDTVGTYLFGLDPLRTPYLRVAAARGLGTHRIEEIEVVDLADGRSLDMQALQAHRAVPVLMPLSRYNGGYYARFRPDGSVAPWALERVNAQRQADGLAPVEVELLASSS